MRKTLMISAALLTLAVAAGCGGDPPVAVDASPAPVATVGQGATAEPAGDPGDAAQAYMEALAATDNPGEMRDGLDHAAPDSPAYVYLTHRANLADAFLDGGIPMDAYDLAPAAGGFDLCEPSGQEPCGLFADFEAIGGLVSHFTVDGEEAGPRLTAGNGETVEDGGVSVEFLTAYNAVSSSSLWVTLRVESGSQPVDVWLYEAAYRAPDGKQRTATDAYGPYELGADSSAMVALVFAGVDPGGTVTLGGVDSTDYLTEFELEVQVG